MPNSVFVNGKFVPEEQAVVSVFDRSFLYGDGLFEAVRVYDGQLFLWKEHLQRLRHGLEILKLRAPLSDDEITEATLSLLRRNSMTAAIVRVLISRGIGERGYSPATARNPLIVISTHPAPAHQDQPPVWKAVTSTWILQADDPLASFKSCNKLRQVLARSEADEGGAQEALLLNTRGAVVEGTTTNLFWVDGGTICTPKLDAGILPGTTRLHLLRLCDKLGIPAREQEITRDALLKADGVFVTSCSIELAELSHLDNISLERSELTALLYKNYRG